MKKAQVEIVGLIIIVILIVIVMSIVLTFKVTEEPELIAKDYFYDQMPTSFLLTFLRTTANCSEEVSFEELLKDCAKNKALSCEGMDSCDYINSTLTNILNQTLNKWVLGYSLQISNIGFKYKYNFKNNFNPNSVSGIIPYIISMWPQKNMDIIMNLSISK